MLVVFENENGARVEKRFSSPYLGMKFVNKAKHSKRIRLLFYESVVG